MIFYSSVHRALNTSTKDCGCMASSRSVDRVLDWIIEGGRLVLRLS